MKHFMVISLSNIDYKEDLFLALQSVGITKASAIDAQSMNKSLESEFSLFKGFLNSENAREGEQLIVFATIETLDTARELIGNLRESGIPLEDGGVLSLSAFPAAFVFDGSIEE